jgi:hypothetical protein
MLSPTHTHGLPTRSWIAGGLRRVSRNILCAEHTLVGRPYGTRAQASSATSATRNRCTVLHQKLLARDLRPNYLSTLGTRSLLNSLPSLPFSRFCSTLPEMSTATTKASGHPDQYRLPTNVKPTHYDLTFKTDLDKLEFDGFVQVR